MSGFPPGGALASPVGITMATVQRGGIIQIGGQPCRVADLRQLPGGAKRLLCELQTGPERSGTLL